MIFGQSGGGGKVVRMMHMPAAKGLFHRVSAQSGGNNTYRTTDPAASIKAQQTIAAHTLKNLNLTRRPDRQAEDGAVLGADHGRAPRRCDRRRRKSAGQRSTGRSSPTTST